MTMGMGEGMGPAEVRVCRGRRRDGAAPCSRRAEELLHGAVRVERVADGWVRPWRVLPSQLRALESCLAWYPGIFRQMAACTAGVALEFATDASRVVVEVRADAEPNATRAVLRGVDGTGSGLAHDGLSADVDGRHLAVRLPEPVADPVPGARRPEPPHVTFELDEGGGAPGGDLLCLPGFGRTRRVRIWLPALRGCELGWVRGDGTVLEPVAARPSLLVLGDSLSQGFVCGDPALAWPSVVSAELGCGLLNQSIGAQVYQPSSLTGAEGIATEVDRVVVMLGANYRYGRCNVGVVGREVSGLLERVSRLWSAAPVWVVTPPADGAGPEPVRGSCYREVAGIVEAACERAAGRRAQRGEAPLFVVDGGWLLDGVEACDADGHPSAEGSALVAERMLGVLDPTRVGAGPEDGPAADAAPDSNAGPDAGPKGGPAGTPAGRSHGSAQPQAAPAPSDCACARELGQRGRCGACGPSPSGDNPASGGKPKRSRRHPSAKKGTKGRRSR